MNKVSALLLVVAAIIICAVLLPVETEAATVDSGTLGNITWVLNDQGVLTISGEGRMPIEHIYFEGLGGFIQYPWHYKRANIKEIVIEEGITNVAMQAFSGCKNLKKVSLPSTLTTIEQDSFYNCEALTSIVIPNGVEYIEEYAFSHCSSLASIDIPSSVKRIYDGAFRDCPALEYFIIHEGVRNIEEYVFVNSGVKYMQIPVSITYMNEYVFFGCDNLSDIYYTGTSDQWEDIGIKGYSKDRLLNVNIHYSSQAPCRNHPYGQFTKISDTQHSRTCAACGYVEKANHTWNSGDITKAATCKEEGVKICTCTSCNATKTEEIAKTNNHSYGSWTDLNNGSHKQICFVCKKEETANHSWDSGKVTKQPTCKEEGVKTYTCSGCKGTKTESVAKTTTHTYGSWTKVNDTTHKQTCSVCSKEETANHTWNSGAVTKKATCKEEGVKTYTCTACSATKTESIAKLTTHTYDHACDTDCNVCGLTRTTTHNYNTTWSKDKSNHWHECSVCKDKKDVAAHTPGAEATETTAQTCTQCGYVIQAALGHTHRYESGWSADESSHWHDCACGSQGDITAHSWNAGEETTPATCKDKGVMTYTCTVCNATKTEEIAKLTTHTPGEEATETTPQVCIVCGKELNPATSTTPPATEPPATEPSMTPTEPAENDQPQEESFPVGIVVAIVVLACGGASVGVIFLKKKH